MKYIAEDLDILDNSLSLFLSFFSREKEKVLNWLITEALSGQDYTEAEPLLEVEIGKHHLRQGYGIKVKSGDYAAAGTKL